MCFGNPKFSPIDNVQAVDDLEWQPMPMPVWQAPSEQDWKDFADRLEAAAADLHARFDALSPTPSSNLEHASSESDDESTGAADPPSWEIGDSDPEDPPYSPGSDMVMCSSPEVSDSDDESDSDNEPIGPLLGPRALVYNPDSDNSTSSESESSGSSSSDSESSDGDDDEICWTPPPPESPEVIVVYSDSESSDSDEEPEAGGGHAEL